MTTRGLILLVLANLVLLALGMAAAYQMVMRQSRTTRRLLRSHMRQVSRHLQRLSGELGQARSSTTKDLKTVRVSVGQETGKLRDNLTMLSKRLQARHQATAGRIASLDAGLTEVSAGIAELSRELAAISGAAAGMESLRDALAHATETVDHAGLLADVALANDLLLEATEMKCRRWYLDAVRSKASDEPPG